MRDTMTGGVKRTGWAKPADNGIESPLTESLKERAYAEIKHRVITCGFKPGEELSENAVAMLLKIGRTPVHQAFDRLHIEGLVDVHPRSGIVVRPINLDEVMEIIEIRLLTECFAVRLAAERASSAEIVAIRKVLLHTDHAVKDRDVEHMMLLDRDFHRLIARAAHNTVLADVLLRLHERSLRLWFISLGTPQHQTSVLQQHDQIWQALSRRDPNAAEAAMRSHIDSFRQNVLRHL